MVNFVCELGLDSSPYGLDFLKQIFKSMLFKFMFISMHGLYIARICTYHSLVRGGGDQGYLYIWYLIVLGGLISYIWFFWDVLYLIFDFFLAIYLFFANVWYYRQNSYSYVFIVVLEHQIVLIWL